MSSGNQASNRSQRLVNMMKMNQSHNTCALLNLRWWSLIVLLIALSSAPLSTLALYFNYHPELAQQHQQNLSPQTYNGLNQNTFYQPPANQFVPGQQFFNNQAFGQTVQLKPQQQIGAGSQLFSPPPSVDVSGIAGQLSEPQRDYTNSYSLDTATPESSVFTESSRIQSINGDELASTSSAPPTSSPTTRRPAPSEQPASSQTSPSTVPKREQTPVERQEAAGDHDVIRSAPSPSSKIQDFAGRDSSVVSAVSTTPIARERSPPSATTTPSSITTTTTTTPAPSTAPANQQRHLLKPMRHNAAAANSNNKDPLKRVEQQIIDQHARAGFSSGQLGGGQRFEQTATTSAPQYLLPHSYRDSGNKLVGSLLSTLLNYNSQPSASGGQDGRDSSLSKLSSASDADRQKTDESGGLLSSLTSNFRSGISSRTSIVKAAMGDNKLARTLTSVGKTIGGNKYVAGAGIAAALAALGLTVGKLMSPYVMMGSNYQKLGGSSFDQLTSGSMLQPTFYDQPGGRPYSWLGGGEPKVQSQYADSLMAAANTPTGYESGSYDTSLYGHQAGEPSNNWPPQFANLRPLRPLSQTTGTVSPFVESANGHYSSYYSNQPSGEQLPTSGDSYAQPSQPLAAIDANYNYNQQPNQFLQPQRHASYGSYVSGAPSQSGPAYQAASISSDHFYSNQDVHGQQAQAMSHEFSPSSYNSGVNQFNADQITASASSDTPTFPYQPQLMLQTTGAANQRPLFVSQGNQRRLGTMRFVVDKKEQQTRPNSDRLVAVGGGNQSTRSRQVVGQQPPATSTISPKVILDLVGRGEWFGLNQSTSSWDANGIASSGNDLKVGQAKQTKQQQQSVSRHPHTQTMTNEDLGSDSIKLVNSPQMQKSRSEATRAPAYLIVASNSSQTQWQASGPAPDKRQRQWKQASRVSPQVVVDTRTGQSSGWQLPEATRQQTAAAAKKSLPQEASEFDFAVATDDEGEQDDETQSANDNKPEAVADDKTTRLRRVTRFDPFDSSSPASLGNESFSIPLEDFFSRHRKGFESSSSSSGATESGQRFGGPQEKSDAKERDAKIGHSGAKYQIDAGGNSFESAATTTTISGNDGDQSTDKANKLIDSTPSSMAKNAATSAPLTTLTVTGAADSAPSTTQHDHHKQHRQNYQYHNHRPQLESNGNNQPAQTDSDNVVVELMPAAGEGRADHEDNNSNGGASKQRAATTTMPVEGRRTGGQLEETETANDRRRSFRGLVAGSIGAS